MTKTSVKQRLIRELEQRAFDMAATDEARYLRARAAQLRARGSGSLPRWAKQMAHDWNIE